MPFSARKKVCFYFLVIVQSPEVNFVWSITILPSVQANELTADLRLLIDEELESADGSARRTRLNRFDLQRAQVDSYYWSIPCR